MLNVFWEIIQKEKLVCRGIGKFQKLIFLDVERLCGIAADGQ